MPTSQILDEFLVSIGFRADESGFGRIRSLLSEAERSVGFHAHGMAASMLGAQGAIAAGFGGVSAAIAGIVSKVAMGDQAYRLMGARMLMTKDSARELSMVTKALGASLEEILWDPTGELQRQALDLTQHYSKLTAILGPGADKAYTGWRNFRLEIEKLKMSVEFLGMKFVAELFKKLDPNAFKTLEAWIEKLNESMPRLANQMANVAMPILKSTWEIFKGLGEIVREGTIAFTNFVGALSGDQAIVGSTFEMEKFGAALQHVAELIKDVEVALIDIEKMIIDVVKALSTALGGQWEEAWATLQQDLSKDWGKFADDLGSTFAQTFVRSASEPIREFLKHPFKVTLGNLKATAEAEHEQGETLKTQERIRNMPLGRYGLPPAVRAQAGDITVEQKPGAPIATQNAPSTLPLKKRIPGQVYEFNAEEFAPNLSGGTNIPNLIRDKVQEYNTNPKNKVTVPVSVALAVAEQESGFQQKAVSNKGAQGVMQLMPETAKSLGVNPHDATENIAGGVALLGQLLAHYKGDLPQALAAYNAGQGAVDRKGLQALLDNPNYAETRKYVPEVLHRVEKYERQEVRIPEIPLTQRTHAPSVMELPSRMPTLPPSLPTPPPPQMGGTASSLSPSTVYSNPRVEVNVGGIHIMQPGASAQDISKAVEGGLIRGLASQAQFDLANLTAFA